MFHSTGSAAIQYSRVSPVVASARRASTSPLHSAADTCARTLPSSASPSTSTLPPSALTSWPASVQSTAPPESARKPRLSIGSKPTRGLLPHRHGEVHFGRGDGADVLVGAGPFELFLEDRAAHRGR